MKKEKSYVQIPHITNFSGPDGINQIEEVIQIKADIQNLINTEIIRLQAYKAAAEAANEAG